MTGWRRGTWTRASARELGEAAGHAGGVQCHAGCPAAEALGHDRLVGRGQPAASPRVIAGGLLLVGGDGADAPGEHRAILQHLVIQQPPDLGQPGIGELTVVIPGPGVQQRHALEAEEIGTRVLIDHGADLRQWGRRSHLLISDRERPGPHRGAPHSAEVGVGPGKRGVSDREG
jgi:hypothetical protein